MRLHRLHRLLAACAALVALQAVADEPEYVAHVQKVYAPDVTVKRVAVAPITCPEELDCDDLQQEVEKFLRKRTRLQIVAAEDTQKMMTRAGIAKLDFETRYILIEGLKVDAIVALEVLQAGVDLMEGEKVKIGQAEVQEGPVKTKHVRLALEMATKDGTALLQADGEGKVQGLKGLDGIAKRTLETMIEQAVPEQE